MNGNHSIAGHLCAPNLRLAGFKILVLRESVGLPLPPASAQPSVELPAASSLHDLFATTATSSHSNTTTVLPAPRSFSQTNRLVSVQLRAFHPYLSCMYAGSCSVFSPATTTRRASIAIVSKTAAPFLPQKRGASRRSVNTERRRDQGAVQWNAMVGLGEGRRRRLSLARPVLRFVPAKGIVLDLEEQRLRKMVILWTSHWHRCPRFRRRPGTQRAKDTLTTPRKPKKIGESSSI